MLKFLRKHARSWLMILIMAVIIIVFVLYFGSNRGGQSAQEVATIDRRVISEGEFHEEYSKLMDMARQRYGSKMTPEMLKQMDLKKIAYDSLLNQQIIIAKAADLKIQISDEELKNMIMSLPAFQTDGLFDERKYQQMLRYNKTSAEDFEAIQKINLTSSKIDALIREGIKISDREIFDVYVMQNQKINVNFIQISGKNVKKKIVPSEAELEDYLKNNSNQFRIPEQVKIKYLSFAASAFSPANISDADVKDYYNRNKDNYKAKDGKQLSLTEVKSAIVKELMKTRGLQHAYAEAKKAHDIIYQEDNFDTYATMNKLKIISMDFFPLNHPPQDFVSIKDLAATLMELQKNDISKVLTADNGYYLVKVMDNKAAYLPKLKDIKNEVEKRFVENELQSLAAKDAQLILERLKKGESLDKIAKEKDLKINETGFFQPGNTIPKLGSIPGAAETLIQIAANNPYPEKLLIFNNSFVILKFKDASKIDIKDFEAKKNVYKKIFLSVKREEMMQTWLEGNKEAMKKEGRIKIKKEVKDL